MISGTYTVIRSAEADDAAAMWRLYDPKRPRSFLLGPTREVMIPTHDEMREILGRRDVVQGSFFTIEDLAGEIRGCCVMRGAKSESEFAEVVVALDDDAAYATPFADEVITFLEKTGFIDKKFNKLVAHCLSNETQYRAYLARHGFVSDGIQRQMVYTRGQYFDLESLSLFNRAQSGSVHGTSVAAS